MKKTALTSLMLLMAIKSVSACSYLPEHKEQYLQNLAERDFNVKLYFFSTVFLVIANIILFVIRNKKDYWLLAVIILTIIASIPITLFVGAQDMCGNSIVTGLQANFVVFISFFIYQILLWVNRTSLQFKKGKITTINLR